MTQLRWALCDFLGRELAPIEEFLEDSLQVAVNDIRTGTVTVSIDDPVAAIVNPLSTRLKAFLNGAIVLNGPIFLPDFEGTTESQPGTLAISATDNFQFATKMLVGFAEQVGVDQSELMARLIEAGDATAAEKAMGIPGHGIIRGELPGSVLRDRTYYDLQNIWEALLSLSQVIDGPDFELEPLDREDGIFAQLNTYPEHQGTDRSADIKLEYGVGATNADSFGWQPSGEQLVNRFIMAGETPEDSPTTPAWISENLESQHLFGIYEASEVDTEISGLPTLKERADGVIATRSFPLDFFSVQPAIMQEGRDKVEAGVPPRFGPPSDPDADFWIADAIGVIARDGLMAAELRGRVTGATLTTADAAGNVAIAISCTSPDRAAGVSGREANLTLGPPNQTAGSEATVPTEEPAIAEPEPAPVAGKRPKKKAGATNHDPQGGKQGKQRGSGPGIAGAMVAPKHEPRR
jgi:hypothetical protein